MAGALTAPDQLRQRVAFALSEMFVVSTNTVNARAVTPYQNILLNDAFRQLLHRDERCDAFAGHGRVSEHAEQPKAP